MEITVTPAELKFAVGIQHSSIFNSINDAIIQVHINSFTTEVTTGLKDDFANVEMLKKIIISLLKYFFWARMSYKDIPEHIREEKKSADRLLRQVRTGEFRDAVVTPTISVKPQYFKVKL